MLEKADALADDVSRWLDDVAAAIEVGSAVVRNVAPMLDDVAIAVGDASAVLEEATSGVVNVLDGLVADETELPVELVTEFDLLVEALERLLEAVATFGEVIVTLDLDVVELDDGIPTVLENDIPIVEDANV